MITTTITFPSKLSSLQTVPSFYPSSPLSPVFPSPLTPLWILPLVSFTSSPVSTFNVLLLRAGEGRRPWATIISPSVPHISFFVYRQPWATTITPSVPVHLIFPGKTTFLNGIYRAFKVWFLKIQPRHAKKHNSNHFFNSTQDYYFVCWILKLLYNEIFGKFDWVYFP